MKPKEGGSAAAARRRRTKHGTPWRTAPGQALAAFGPRKSAVIGGLQLIIGCEIRFACLIEIGDDADNVVCPFDA